MRAAYQECTWNMALSIEATNHARVIGKIMQSGLKNTALYPQGLYIITT